MAVSSSAGIYWVNQDPGNTSIWARFSDRRGSRVPHWDRLRAMTQGDIIVHNVKRNIWRISRVTATPLTAPRPPYIKDPNDPANLDVGTIVPIETFELVRPVRLDDLLRDPQSRLAGIDGGPIRSDGSTVMLGYAFNFSTSELKVLKRLYGNPLPDWADPG